MLGRRRRERHAALRHQVRHRGHRVDRATPKDRRACGLWPLCRATTDTLRAANRRVLSRLLFGQGDVQLTACRLREAVKALQGSILSTGPIRRLPRTRARVEFAVPVEIGLSTKVCFKVNAGAATPFFTPTRDSLVLGFGLLIHEAFNLRAACPRDNFRGPRNHIHRESRLTAMGLGAI